VWGGNVDRNDVREKLLCWCGGTERSGYLLQNPITNSKVRTLSGAADAILPGRTQDNGTFGWRLEEVGEKPKKGLNDRALTFGALLQRFCITPVGKR
jgi:hypothetical protein